MSYSAAPSTACSPTKSGKWNNSPRLERAKGGKANKSAANLFINTSPVSKKNPSASFFKNYSLTPAANRPTFNRDIAIAHESRIYKSLISAVQKKTQSRRDPILLNNNEQSVEFKPSVRRLASADRMGSNLDENFKRSKKVGDYNHVYSPRPEAEDQLGIKTFRVLPSACSDEQYTRLRKARCTSSEGVRNPIIDGDEKSAIFKRWRGAGVQADEHQRLNDKKYLMSSERNCSPKGKVFRDMTLTLGEYDYGSDSKYEQNCSLSASRPVTAFEEKMRGYAKSTINYDNSPKFRLDVIAEKITKNQPNQTMQRDDHTKVFGRRITLKN